MLTVGIDTYVSLEEAENIIRNNSLSTDSAYQKWQELSDNDKEVLLRNSCRDINALKFEGRRARYGQKLEFPRVQSTVSGIGYRLFVGQFQDNGLISGYGSSDGGLSLAKQAQCINAVYAALYSNVSTELIGVQIQGLTSKKAGPIAESYNRNNQDANDALIGIYTRKVYSILTPWLSTARFSY